MNNCKILRVGSLNIRSILPSLQELRQIISDHSFDVFTVSETWLHRGIPDRLLNINGYKLYRCDRETRGGGLCIYVTNTLNTTIFPTGNTIEQLWVNFTLYKHSYAIGVVYKPPTFDTNFFLSELEDSLSLIAPTADHIICTGDFNINVLNLQSTYVNNLYSVLETFNLEQIVDTPTRITDISTALIDLILTFREEKIIEKGVLQNNSSDHDIVFCVLKVKNKSSEPKLYTYRSFKNFCYELFEIDLYNIPWYLIYDINSVDEKVRFLVDNLVFLFDIHVPFITSRFTRPYAPWLTDHIKMMMSTRDKALAKYKRTKNEAHWQFYKEMRNYTRAAIRRDKKAYFEYKINISTPKDCWKFLKNNNLLPHNKNNEIPDHLSDVNEINNFFVNAIPTVTASEPILNFYKSNTLNNSNFKFQKTNESTVLKVLNNISTNAAGCDGLNAKLLKLCCPHIIPYITDLINFCLVQNVFPSEWKKAVVTVLPKKSNPEEFKDLRAISILPTLSKLIEKIMEMQLRQYLVQNNLIPTTQSGFRPGHSCTTALLDIVDDIIGATDRGMCTCLVLLDFSRAFDTINYEMLKSILHYIGFSEDSVKLIDNYTKNREQCVRLNNVSSNYLTLTSGVPQGSILGPLLFTIYTSNLVSNVNHCKIHLYADDTQLYYSFPSLDVERASFHINEDINKFIIAAQGHCLIINPNKSEVIIFGPKKQKNVVKSILNIAVEDTVLEKKDSVKSLGVIIDSDLRFENHIDKVLQKGYLSLKLIYGNRQCLPQKTKIMLCETLVLSLFNYADSLYGPCLNSLYTRKIQKLQNSCLRLIYGIRKNQRISHKLCEVKWLNMQNRRIHHAACLFHALILNKSPSYLYRKIKFRTDVHNLNVRFKGLLTPPMHRSQFFTRSFSYQICKIYNGISDELKTKRISNFKGKYKSILLERQAANL